MGKRIVAIQFLLIVSICGNAQKISRIDNSIINKNSLKKSFYPDNNIVIMTNSSDGEGIFRNNYG